MKNRKTLRYMFGLGTLTIGLVLLSSLLSVHYVALIGASYKNERNHKVSMLHLRSVVEAVEAAGDKPVNAKVTDLKPYIATAHAVDKWGQVALTLPEQMAFRAIGFGNLIDWLDLDLAYLSRMRAVLDRAKGGTLTAELAAELHPILDEQSANSARYVPMLEEATRFLQSMGITLAILGAALLLWIGWLIRRSVLQPLTEAIGIADRVAAGDLTQQIEGEGSDEFGQLLTALKRMQGSLQSVAQEVRSASARVHASAGRIAQGNASLLDRSEQQASTLQETSASMEQMAASVRHNTNQAQEVQQLIASARTLAQDTGTAAERLSQTMARIEQSSREVADISSLIDGIAFQTNILALNAAVEAARAGSHGRGFAVVAQEVRSLAQKSSTAAKEIRALIADATARVRTGNQLASENGEKMRAMVASVNQVATISETITGASKQQANDVAQVNAAVSDLERTTEQYLQFAQHAATASQALTAEAEHLVHVGYRFRLDETADAATAVDGTHFATIPKPWEQPAVAAAAVAGPRTAEKRIGAETHGERNESWEEF